MLKNKLEGYNKKIKNYKKKYLNKQNKLHLVQKRCKKNKHI